MRLKKIKNISVFCVLLSILSCKTPLYSNLKFTEVMDLRSVEAKKLENESDIINCNKNTNHSHSNYLIMNNLWGESKVKKGIVSLCTFSKGDKFGWKWQSPNNAKGVIGFPSIKIGGGPWQNSTEKINDFPVPLDSIKSLAVDYETEIYTKYKTYNLAFDIWLNSTIPAVQENITTEIMVWEDYYDFNSYGKKIDELNTPFGIYNVMSGYLKNDKFNQNWQYYAFVRQVPRQSGQVDIKYLLDYLVENKMVQPSDFATSVEFGNEFGDSSGFTLVKKFNFTLGRK